MIPRRTSHGARPRARGRAPHPHGRHGVRKEILALHREIFERNRRRINESVLGYTPAFRRYERAYAQRVRTYRRRVALERLDAAIARATAVYVGDYHTLGQAQRGFLRLLRRLPPERPVTVALEFVQGKHQDAIDAYLAGHLDDHRFLQAIEHDSHWIFGGWDSFRQIFELCRERGHRVLGIDSAGRGPAGSSLEARDRYAARRIARHRRRHPDDLVMVLVGELHVAPCHLPARVDEATGPADPPHRPLTVYQNCEEIYWALEARGRELDTELVQVSPAEFCLLNTPPIVCQQSFLNWLQAEDDAFPWEATEQSFKDTVRLITQFFELDIGDALEEVEVATVVDLSFLQRLRQRGDFSREEIARIHEQILRSESYFIPRARTVYLGNLSVNHAAEEATHFIRHVLSGSHEPRLLVDAFYWRVLEEAVGFLGSKIINHKRKCAHTKELMRLCRSRRTSGLERRVARLALKHERLELGERVRGTSHIYDCDADTFNALTHVVGYRLGDRMYYALIEGRLSKEQARALFHDPFDGEGDALATYLTLSALTRDVALPERM